MRKNSIQSIQNEYEGRQLRDYLIYTFGIAWAAELFLIAVYKLKLVGEIPMSVLHYVLIAFGPGFAPAYSAIIVKRKYFGWTVKDTLKEFCSLGKKKRTFFMLGAFAVIQLAACCVLESYRGNPWYLFVLFMPLMILGGGMEELGWQGVMMPLMEKKFPFGAAIIMQGVLWAFWHLPLWFVPDSSQRTMNFGAFMLYCIVLECSLALLYRYTKSVAACVLLHAWGNTTMGGMYTMTALTNTPDVKILLVYLGQVLLFVCCYKKMK